MQIKKFSAPTLKEAAQKMKDELGGEAIILGTRMIESSKEAGERGRIKEKLFELTAGIEKTPAYSLLAEQKLTQTSLKQNIREGGSDNSRSTYEEEIAKLKEMIYKRRNIPLYDNEEQKISGSEERQLDSGKKESELSKKNENPELKKIFNTLRRRDVQKSTLNALSGTINNYKNIMNSSNTESYVLSSMASLITTNKLKLERNKKAKKVALVGPTGVGKTTCIAKLSVISKLIHNLEIGLISIDTYRLGAIDQLKIFSEISNIELKVAYEPKEMPDILSKFRKKDLIFIDTAGRSQNNIKQLYEAKEFLNASQVDETYLVISSTSSTKLLLDVINKYKVYNYNSIIYTKIDEAVTFGNILNVSVKKSVPISFLSNGQVIPDDIIAADSEFIANMIYTGKINK